MVTVLFLYSSGKDQLRADSRCGISSGTKQDYVLCTAESSSTHVSLGVYVIAMDEGISELRRAMLACQQELPWTVY